MENEDEMKALLMKLLSTIENEPSINEKMFFINNVLSSKGSVSVRISKKAFDSAKVLCDEMDMSINNYVTTAVAMRLYEDMKKRNKE